MDDKTLKELLARAKADPPDRDAMKALVIEYTPNIVKVVNKWWGNLIDQGLATYINKEDLMGYAYEGFLYGIRLFDINKVKGKSLAAAFGNYVSIRVFSALRDGLEEFFGEEYRQTMFRELPYWASGEEVPPEQEAKQYEVTTTANFPDVAPGRVDVKVLSPGRKKKKKKRKKKEEESLFQNFTSATIKGLVHEDRMKYLLSLSREELEEVIRQTSVGDMVKFVKAYSDPMNDVYIEENAIGEVFNIDDNYYYVKLLHKTDQFGLEVKIHKDATDEYLMKL